MPHAATPNRSADLERHAGESVARIRYALFKAVIDSGMKFDKIAKRAGISKTALRNILFSFKPDITIRDIANIMFAIKVEPEFRIIPRDEF